MNLKQYLMRWSACSRYHSAVGAFSTLIAFITIASCPAAYAQLPPKLAIQPTFKNFLAFEGDGKWHASYTLFLTNFTKQSMKIMQLEVTGSREEMPVYTNSYGPGELPQLFSSVSGDYTTPQQPLLAPGASGVLYLSLDFSNQSAVPDSITNHVSVQMGENTDAPSQTITIEPLTRNLSETEPIGAPLRGKNWWTSNGPSNDAIHRRTLIVLLGKLSLTEEFAVDWVRLGTNGASFSGDPKNNTSYFAYNQDVVAAADGRILSTLDGISENVPNEPPAVALAVDNLAGNHIIEDFGDGRYALYAHLIPGSLTVLPGQYVHKGQVLGKLGNSGNSSQPHLHFHVMNGTNPLGSRGIPFQIGRWTRHRYQIVCPSSTTDCSPLDGPTDLRFAGSLPVRGQAFMMNDLGDFR